MLWSKKSIQFAPEDVETLIAKALPKIAEKAAEPVYMLNGDVPALLTESEVKRQVESLLQQATETLDTTAIANQLGFPKQSVDAVISHAAASSNSFFDGVHVLSQRTVEAIGDAVLAKHSITSLSEICHTEGITLKAARFAVKNKSPHLIITGPEDSVVPEKVLTEHVQAFKKALDSTKTPVKYADLEKDPLLLNLVKHQLNISAHQAEYLPPAFVREKQTEAETLLSKSGYIEVAYIKSIEDAGKFAKRTQSVVITHRNNKYSWIVSKAFIEEQHKTISTTLSRQGFVDLRETPLYPELTTYIVDDMDKTLAKFRNSQRFAAHYLVKPSFERDLLARVNKTLKTKAQEQAAILPIAVTGSSTVKDFVSQIELPSLATITEILGDDIPLDLKISEHIFPQVRKTFTEELTQTLAPRIHASIETLEIKIRCYLNAINSLPSNSDLQSLAWDEWQQYVSEQQFSVPANLEIAQQQFKITSEESEALLNQTAQQLKEKMRFKLGKLKNRAKDAALILHFASTIYHSEHFMTEPGLLKVRGKTVPKLIKQFEFPPCFEKLRKQIKEPSEELLIEVRESLN